MPLRSSHKRHLTMQGFSCDAGSATACNEPWLRATPALSTAWIAGATAAGSPAALLVFSVISALGGSRRTHPFDYALKQVRRHTSAGRFTGQSTSAAVRDAVSRGMGSNDSGFIRHREKASGVYELGRSRHSLSPSRARVERSGKGRADHNHGQ